MNMTSESYDGQIWDNYADDFLAIMPSMMLEVNKEVADLATGDVIDFGCGAAKIAPFVLDNCNVKSYTGIDYSLDMVKLAHWHLQQFPQKPSEIIHGKIESIDVEPYEVEVVPGYPVILSKRQYDFGLSINSYYAWDDTEKILHVIYNSLRVGARFVLVTPNNKLDIIKILDEVKKEQVANPHYERFRKKNISIVGNKNSVFIDMDDLILQAHRIGFKVCEAHQKFYYRGLNYLVLMK